MDNEQEVEGTQDDAGVLEGDAALGEQAGTEGEVAQTSDSDSTESTEASA